MNNYDELFNEEEFEAANNGLQNIQKYNDNKEAIEFFTTIFKPTEELIDKTWELFGKPFVILAILQNDALLDSMTDTQKIFENLDGIEKLHFLVELQHGFDNESLANNLSEAFEERLKDDSMLNIMLFQQGTDLS